MVKPLFLYIQINIPEFFRNSSGYLPETVGEVRFEPTLSHAPGVTTNHPLLLYSPKDHFPLHRGGSPPPSVYIIHVQKGGEGPPFTIDLGGQRVPPPLYMLAGPMDLTIVGVAP